MRPLFVAAVVVQVLEQVLVAVNGDILTRRQLDERVRSVIAQQLGRAIAAGDLRTDPSLRQRAEALTPKVASDAIAAHLRGLRAQALVDWKDRALKAAYEAASKDR